MAELRLAPEATKTDVQSSFSGFYQAAAPTMERPTGAGAGLMELAKGLGAATDAFDQFATEQTKQQREQDILEARSLRIQNQMNFAEATRQGLIPVGMNPWAIKEYHRVDGEITAQDNYKAFIDQRLKEMNFVAADYQNEAEASAALRGELGRAQKDFLQTYGANSTHEWMLGFQQGSRGVHEALVNTYQNDRAKFNEEKFTAATGAVINQVLTNPEMSPAEKAAQLDTLAKERRGQFGMGFKEYNDLVVTQSTAQAITLAQEGRFEEAQDALEVLASIPTGPGSTLAMSASDKIMETELRISQIERNRKEDARSDIRWGWAQWAQQRAIQDAERSDIRWEESREDRARQEEMQAREDVRWLWSVEDRSYILTDRAWTDSERSRVLAERGKEELKDGMLADGINMILRNPGADHTTMYQEIMEQASDKAVAAEVVSALQGFESARYNANQRIDEDESVIADLRVGIEEGTTRTAEITAAYANRQINGGTFMALMDDYRSRRSEMGNAAKAGQTARQEVLDTSIKEIGSLIRGADEGISVSDTRRVKAANAQARARKLAREWQNANPDASAEEYYRFSDFLKERILNDSRFKPESIGTEEAYRPVEDIRIINQDGSLTEFGRQVDQLVTSGTLTFRTYEDVNRFASDYSRAIMAGSVAPPTPEMLITTQQRADGTFEEVPTFLYVSLALQDREMEAVFRQKFPNVSLDQFR